MCVCVCVCVCTRVCARVCVCLLHERINGRHVCQCKVCKFANTHVHVGVLISWCSSCVYERERVCVCVCVLVFMTQPTWAEQRNMDVCWIDRSRDGRVQERTDGWWREGWILTDQWKDWQPENNGNIQTLCLFFSVANFPGTPIFALLRYDDCSWILEVIYYLICRILMCLYPRVIYWKPFSVSLSDWTSQSKILSDTWKLYET